MKIKKVECEQFAGLREKELQFSDGLNLVIGENESGKSTMVDLIYHLLFMPVKLDGRKQKHEEFMRLYFPKKVSGPQGDCVDGTLRFETQEGKFRLSKEWQKDGGSCKLTLPDGTILRTEEKVSEILAKELSFGEGVYAELIFASQKRKQNIVESILHNMEQKKDTNAGLLRKELAAVINRAVLETGGVALDKLEDKLTKTLGEYTGRWDFVKDLPEDYAKHGIGHEWQKNAGIIVQAFYAKERLAKAQKEAEWAEGQVELYKAQIREADALKRRLEEDRSRFQKYSGALREKAVLKEQLLTRQQLLVEREDAYRRWPQVNEQLESAVVLQKKLEQAVVADKFVRVQTLQETYQENKEHLAGMAEITSLNIRSVQQLLQKQSKLTGQIAGLKVVAKIKQLGTQPVEITTIAEGKALDTAQEELLLSEAVSISVAGVMEMQLLPQGIDMDMVKKELEQIKGQLAELFAEYGVDSLESMQEQADAYQLRKGKVQELEGKLALTLGDQTWEQLKQEYNDLPQEVQSLAEVRERISGLCGNKTLERFIGELESSKTQYSEKYVSMEELEQSILKLQEQINAAKTRLENMEQVPQEYQNISDAEGYEADLTKQIEKKEERIKQIREQLSGAERGLGEKAAEEYSEELLQAETKFEEVKMTYQHWKHMYDTFVALKERVKTNPTLEIAEKFKEYLGVISSAGLDLHEMDEQLAVQLSSGNRALNYEILSEGTKDTISLAFRLAMLEHLYPNGGGMAVFDDPFTDMDPKRVQQACKLLEKYAEHNQVIFITCDGKYKEIMAGNVLIYEH